MTSGAVTKHYSVDKDKYELGRLETQERIQCSLDNHPLYCKECRRLKVAHFQIINDINKLFTEITSLQRLIAASQEPRGFVAVANILKKAGYSGPSTHITPNFLLKFAALFDREAKGMIGMLDMNLSADNRLTRHALEWTPMAFEQLILDNAAKITDLQAN